MKKIKLAMIQLGNHCENQALGYKEATSLITQAASEGAEMAILPELSACGYIPNQSIWQYSESGNGKTAQWASELSALLGIYIGAGFVETDGKDFYNSYLLSNPKGGICGIIRKEDAESYCFKRCKGNLYIDTDIGRIGFGICADNHYIQRLCRMKDVNIDLMIMPHANPSPYQANKQISKKDLELFEKQPLIITTAYSNYLRVPTVYVNAVGLFPEFTGGLWFKNFNEIFRLQGGSLVTNARGKPLVKMDNVAGYKVCDIPLDKTSEAPVEPAIYHGKWLHQGNALFRYLIMPHLIRKGIRGYNKEHLKKAKKVTTNTTKRI